ncbi:MULTISPECIES: flagellin domain-containing protein [unclassified Pseudoalteromonas]|uniref:flagellin domain-containing protein n=1 Tax=unclassified Pseudoalteromonas TaxID=194690 RepID=UPI002359DEEB|nr:MULTISPECIES: flagellin domain-containing protein [unclassified Pseudoalteromonas]MDC9565180.1 flagellin domain-containing protein [Pseudoalteromonas sp. GAB2316C]MDC9567784.1 flagellin domain-containing protein [Pseudoalteromonas sp. GABNB9D]MDC9573591.1 flagellin domain-containing protein [Pseudoalteromonas sp. GABNS16A]MDC9577890.1 flagellin domain-containing protein [Pseudoalteromonas sp. GABNS16E]MDC9585543.1 flagellin domain-containing protein [Pseudoalteromonas sp. GABNS16C]
MAITVNTNVSSLNAQRNLTRSGEGLATSMERLASGMRINSAKDDAAGLQISNRLTSQINGLAVAQRNANDGISMAQTAEGAMQESTNILQRMRELALQSSNGSNSETDRDAMQKEVVALQTELTRIAETTSFGDQQLLNGDLTTVSFQVGANVTANDKITVTLADIDATALGVNAVDIGDTTGTGDPDAAVGLIDTAIASIDDLRAGLGAVQNRFGHTLSNLANIQENVSASRSRIQDTDFATETAEMTKNQILQQAGTSILSQANQLPQAALSLLG